MVQDKGLAPESADQIGEFVKLKGGKDLLDILYKNEKLTANASALKGLDDMKLLYTYLEAFEVDHRVRKFYRFQHSVDIC
jgi:histidyl-tRNA synthetase